MNNHPEEQREAVKPEALGEGCAYALALAIVGTLSFVEAVPYHICFYAWCAWHFTGGQICLLIMSWRLHLEQRRVRRENPWYRKANQ